MQIFALILSLLLISPSEAGPLRRDVGSQRGALDRQVSVSRPDTQRNWARQSGANISSLTTTSTTGATVSGSPASSLLAETAPGAFPTNSDELGTQTTSPSATASTNLPSSNVDIQADESFPTSFTLPSSPSTATSTNPPTSNVDIPTDDGFPTSSTLPSSQVSSGAPIRGQPKPSQPGSLMVVSFVPNATFPASPLSTATSTSSSTITSDITPSSSPEPAPSPEPSTIPEPAPSPEPSSSPEPAPSPEPSTSPEPSSSSEPAPNPEPSTIPGPAPSPEPSSSPEPVPSPEPSPSPEASSNPEPSSRLEPSTSGFGSGSGEATFVTSSPLSSITEQPTGNSSENSSVSSTHYRATGAVNAQVPTALTSLPSASTTVSPADYAANVDRARQLNMLYANLTDNSACTSNQAACIKGNVGRCRSDGSYDIIFCPTGTSCFALPMNNVLGVLLDCVDTSEAEGIFGNRPVASSPDAPGTSNATTECAGTNSTVAAESYSRTTTVTRGGSGITLTVTVTETTTSAQTSSTQPAITSPSSVSSPSAASEEPTATTPTTLGTESAPLISDYSIFITKSFASNAVVPTVLPATTTITVKVTATHTVPAGDAR